MPGDPGDGGINSPGIKGDRGIDGLPGPQVSGEPNFLVILNN